VRVYISHPYADDVVANVERVRAGRQPSLSPAKPHHCAYLKVTNDGAHRAMADAERAFQVYRHLMEARP
jgi:hypothetical protein